MPKVLAQAGTSLADVYDVEGSVAGVEDLESREVHLFHEMGSTIFSERVRGRVSVLTPGAIAQNLPFDITVVLPPGISRIHNWMVVDTSAVAGRILHCQMSISSISAGDETDCPFWVWELATDRERSCRMQVSGAAIATLIALGQTSGSDRQSGPLMGYGAEQPSPIQAVNQLIFRGRTSGFGAGTAIPSAILYDAFAITVRPSSRGLPVPSW